MQALLSDKTRNLVRHPYKKDPERDPNLENYPFGARIQDVLYNPVHFIKAAILKSQA